MTTYVFTEAFLTYLQHHRPGIYHAVRRAGLTQCRLSFPRGPGRSCLEFRGLDDYNPQCFDRQVDHEYPCLVLDGHPDVIATSPRPAGSRPVLATDIGDKFCVDTLLLATLRGWPPEEFPDRVAEAEVVARQAYVLSVRVGSHTIPWDIDELRCMCQDLAWRPPVTGPAVG